MNPKRRIIPVFIPHAGCTHNCVFCDQRHISGAAAVAEPEDIHAAAALADNSHPTELALYGGSFTALPVIEQNELLLAARPFLEKNPQNSIRISTRPDCIDEATVASLKNHGVATVELGAQSMCDDVLIKSRRGHTASDVLCAAAIIKNAGLSLILQMMTGLPGDTCEKSRQTTERFIGLAPDGVRIYPAVVVRETELFEMWRRGDYGEHTVEDAVSLCAELCEMFEDAQIPVIRLGLNPTERLSKGYAAAGAYHPALGELVYGRMYLNKAIKALNGAPPGSDVVVSVAKGRAGMMIGHRRGNIDALTQRFALRSLKVVEDDLEPGMIKITLK